MELARRVLQSIAVVSIGLALLLFAASFFAPSASALTADEIQVQIKELLAKISELTKQLNILQGQNTTPSVVSDTMPMKHRICGAIPLARNLTQGTQGDDVRGLQEFLSTEGYLSANATGYFGPMTAQAVAKWQASQGVSAVGSFGPMSRERVKVWCGTADRFSATPQRGLAPLVVTFVAPGGSSCVDGGDYEIDFGDGTTAPTPSCQGGKHRIQHTYINDGTYTAVLYAIPSGFGMEPVQIQRSVAGKVQIYVGPVACTKEYKPVCGSKPIVCITTPCNPIQQTYGNRCEMNADGATFLYEGQCRSTTDPANDPRCKAWYDGCNTCSRSAPGQPAMCTLRACMLGSEMKAYCTAWFDDSGNKPPVISSFSGPTTLAINGIGTWTIKASDPENGSLSYDIRWGDENYAPVPMASYAARETVVQTTTFTHAYNKSGNYTITIIVRDGSGMEAKTSSTVRIGTVECPAVMAPYGETCTTPSGQTGTWHYLQPDDTHQCPHFRCVAPEPVACTGDAMQCPDGTYVGRTTPNCQFVCPN